MTDYWIVEQIRISLNPAPARFEILESGTSLVHITVVQPVHMSVKILQKCWQQFTVQQNP